METLYRVRIRETGSLQPSGSFWDSTVLYCGYDVEEARRVFHENKPEDFGGSYGNPEKETLFEKLDQPGDLVDDDPGEMDEMDEEDML